MIFNVPFVYSNAGVVTYCCGRANMDPRWCPGYTGIATILLQFALDFNNPPDHPNCFKLFKHPGSIPDRHGSPRSCHGLSNGSSRTGQGFVTDWPRVRHGLAKGSSRTGQGFVTVSLQFITPD